MTPPLGLSPTQMGLPATQGLTNPAMLGSRGIPAPSNPASGLSSPMGTQDPSLSLSPNAMLAAAPTSPQQAGNQLVSDFARQNGMPSGLGALKPEILLSAMQGHNALLMLLMEQLQGGQSGQAGAPPPVFPEGLQFSEGNPKLSGIISLIPPQRSQQTSQSPDGSASASASASGGKPAMAITLVQQGTQKLEPPVTVVFIDKPIPDDLKQKLAGLPKEALAQLFPNGMPETMPMPFVAKPEVMQNPEAMQQMMQSLAQGDLQTAETMMTLADVADPMYGTAVAALLSNLGKEEFLMAILQQNGAQGMGSPGDASMMAGGPSGMPSGDAGAMSSMGGDPGYYSSGDPGYYGGGDPGYYSSADPGYYSGGDPGYYAEDPGYYADPAYGDPGSAPANSAPTSTSNAPASGLDAALNTLIAKNEAGTLTPEEVKTFLAQHGSQLQSSDPNLYQQLQTVAQQAPTSTTNPTTGNPPATLGTDQSGNPPAVVPVDTSNQQPPQIQPGTPISGQQAQDIVKYLRANYPDFDKSFNERDKGWGIPVLPGFLGGNRTPGHQLESLAQKYKGTPAEALINALIGKTEGQGRTATREVSEANLKALEQALQQTPPTPTTPAAPTLPTTPTEQPPQTTVNARVPSASNATSPTPPNTQNAITPATPVANARTTVQAPTSSQRQSNPGNPASTVQTVASANSRTTPTASSSARTTSPNASTGTSNTALASSNTGSPSSARTSTPTPTTATASSRATTTTANKSSTTTNVTLAMAPKPPQPKEATA